ncbi:putative ATPase [Ilumatobacter fluminis]|uniref:Putative ATPase n=1 Tax=Ilumatobacter fluminis TaxID=467091 RepID=A0A4R7HUZ7_9ACTN|nr:AAA family ATPase [Ilumatobacter fluminis]TDT14781.1 putative ATPase [Ilumatobacter fluminis]
MLLRLEVDGFKNLSGFDAQFGPFTCIAGENGVGKSNVFDAIEFLSLISDMSLMEAAGRVRSSQEDGVGEPEHLFTIGSDDPRMRLAAEMIVPPRVTDDFGVHVEPAITLLRYEVELGLKRSTGTSRGGQLVVEREELRHINRGDAHKHLRFRHDVKKFRNAIVVGERRGGPFISTEPENDRITVHQDGGSRGRPRRQLPTRAGTTVVSTINSADDPTVLAVRREIQSWRRLALEPSALRAADRFVDPDVMGSDGRHLAAALHRIATALGGGDPEDVYARVANRVAGLAGVDIRSLRVDVDETRQLYSLIVCDADGRELPARSLSEGTLRYLALCVLLEDPRMTGLITMEEPENGIHPANLQQVVDLVRELAVDATIEPGPDNPLRQVIVNTHSPAVVALMDGGDLLYARLVPDDRAGRRREALRLLGMQDSWRAVEGVPVATRADLLPYLATPPGAQISLFPVT